MVVVGVVTEVVLVWFGFGWVGLGSRQPETQGTDSMGHKEQQ